MLFESKRIGITFLSHSTVTDVHVEVVGETFVLEVELGALMPLEPARRLEDFTYSLQKVYRYRDPTRHFRRRYVSLQPGDYRALVDGRVFWARTAFAEYLSSLPMAAVQRFVQGLAAKEPEALFLGAPYSRLWGHLRAFIEAEYVATADLLRALADRIPTAADASLDVSFAQLRLGTDDDEHVDSPADQMVRLDEFINTVTGILPGGRGDGGNVFDLISQMILESSESESEFEDAFKGTQWPTSVAPSF